jgi:hypothetical protein
MSIGFERACWLPAHLLENEQRHMPVLMAPAEVEEEDEEEEFGHYTGSSSGWMR